MTGIPVRCFVAISALLVLVSSFAIEAPAHAIVVQSDPADGSTVHSPRQLMLQFNGRVEKALCTASLVVQDHHILPLHEQPGPAPDVLVYSLPGLKPGSYQVRWKVLSADGHLTGGAVRFSVVSP